ncbi:hypothetical protein ABZP36_019729 [Zizania latifolia]
MPLWSMHILSTSPPVKYPSCPCRPTETRLTSGPHRSLFRHFGINNLFPWAPPEQESLEIPSPSSCGGTNKDASVRRRERRSDRIET